MPWHGASVQVYLRPSFEQLFLRAETVNGLAFRDLKGPPFVPFLFGRPRSRRSSGGARPTRLEKSLAAKNCAYFVPIDFRL